DDIAIACGVLRAHHHEVPLEDAGVLHRVAANPQQVLTVSAACYLGNGDVVLDICLREYRLPGGYRAQQRETTGANDPAHALHRTTDRAVEQLDRAWVGWGAAEAG